MSCSCHSIDRSKGDKRCKSCACRVFKTLDVGTTIRIIIGDDDYFENQEFTFACFDEQDCCVTLQDRSRDETFIVDCRAIKGVKFES